MIKTKDAKKGGYLVGKPHSEGGIKGINVDTNQPIEVEGGEVVITKPAVESQETYEFEGKEMKPREILSKINADHGGVAFAKGGMVGKNEYAQGGEVYTDFIKSLNDYYNGKPFLELKGGGIDSEVKYVDKVFMNAQDIILVKYKGADIDKAIFLINCIFKGTYLYVKPPTKEYQNFFGKDYQEIVGNRNGFDGCAPFQVSDFSVVVSGKIAQLNLARRLFIKAEYAGLQDFWLDEKYFNSDVVSVLPNIMANWGSLGFYYSKILGDNDLKFISNPTKLNLGFIVYSNTSKNLVINEYTELNVFQNYYETSGQKIFLSRQFKNNFLLPYGVDSFKFLSVGAKVKIKLLDDQPLWEIDKTKIVRDDHSYYTVTEYITPQNSPVYVKSISPSTSEIVVTIDGFNLTYQDFDRTITLGCYYFTAENGKTYSTAFYGYADMYVHFSRMEVVEVIETVYEKYLKAATEIEPNDSAITKPVNDEDKTDIINKLNDYYKGKKFLVVGNSIKVSSYVTYVKEIFWDDLTGIMVKDKQFEVAYNISRCIFAGTFLYVNPPENLNEFFGSEYNNVSVFGKYDGCTPFQVKKISHTTEGEVQSIRMMRHYYNRGVVAYTQDFSLYPKYFDLSNVVKVLPNLMPELDANFADDNTKIVKAEPIFLDKYSNIITNIETIRLGFQVSKPDLELGYALNINDKINPTLFSYYYEDVKSKKIICISPNGDEKSFDANSFDFISKASKVKIQFPDTAKFWEIYKESAGQDTANNIMSYEYVASDSYLKISDITNGNTISVKILDFIYRYDDKKASLVFKGFVFETEVGKQYITVPYNYDAKKFVPEEYKITEVIETPLSFLRSLFTSSSQSPAIPEPATVLTQAELLEAEIITKKKKDESNAIKYELLLEGIEMEEAKLIVMRAISKDNPTRLKEIDRKLETIARKKGEYALKKDTALDLLDKFENSVQAEKVTEEIREYNISINGQQSELTPSQYTRVRTEMFMDWFGNWIDAYETNDYTGVSKVINPRTAEPIVLYHGTDKDFTAWTFDQFPAAYFADNLSYSEWFASQKSAGQEGQLYEVFLSIKNPIDFRMFGLNEVSMRDIFTHLQNEYGLNSADYLPVLAKLDKTALERALDLKLKIWQFVRKTTGFIKYLKDETFFDGILMFEDNPEDLVGGVPNITGSYVAFFTSQIKWATANFFNPAIEDNRFKFGGTV